MPALLQSPTFGLFGFSPQQGWADSSPEPCWAEPWGILGQAGLGALQGLPMVLLQLPQALPFLGAAHIS